MTQKLQPIYDRIIVKPLDKEDKTVGGIIIPAKAQESHHMGRVLITGKGRMDNNGKIKPMTIKVGDVVFYGPNVGLEVKHDGCECLVMNEDDVTAIIDQ